MNNSYTFLIRGFFYYSQNKALMSSEIREKLSIYYIRECGIFHQKILCQELDFSVKGKQPFTVNINENQPIFSSQPLYSRYSRHTLGHRLLCEFSSFDLKPSAAILPSALPQNIGTLKNTIQCLNNRSEWILLNPSKLAQEISTHLKQNCF